ncbi:MAG: hypothetical protein H6734_11415 [Alphaproteobacteria bacterium]|nr:hypothetical protein [Alphaproteobacteria bacterium]
MTKVPAGTHHAVPTPGTSIESPAEQDSTHARAASASTMPAARPSTGSSVPEPARQALMRAGDAVGLVACMRDTSPATSGAAMDVPLNCA